MFLVDSNTKAAGFDETCGGVGTLVTFNRCFCSVPKVLELLKVAWMRRLIFTVGTSSTTGEPDTVVWNGIHHKTEMMSNLSGHGYPDPNYLDNVLSELASQGVTEDCLGPPGSSS